MGNAVRDSHLRNSNKHSCLPLDAMDVDQQTFMIGRNALAAGESLAPDPSTYEMLHTLSTAWPCLSFDILPDDLGSDRKTYPATVYAVAGTQAESRRARENELMVMKLSGLSRMERGSHDTDSDSDSEDDDLNSSDESAEPILETKSLPLRSTTNRISAHRFPASSATTPTTLTASMTESAELLIHDITPHLTSFDQPGTTIAPSQSQPISTLKHHGRTEGYALAWSPLFAGGKLLSGDNDGRIFLSSPADTGGSRWTSDARPFTGHAGSVEDVAWSPNERSVFASASSDGTVKVWDVRSKSRRPAVDVRVADTDINVLSWSHLTPHLLATGAEDGVWAVWDLRQWKPGAGATPANTNTAKSNTTSSSSTKSGSSSGAGAGGAELRPTPVASFAFHSDQITSLAWHPTDDSIVAVAGGDNTLTLWDLAVELDDEESRDTAGVADVPPQLLFVHYVEGVRELHWHPQIPGAVMCTGANGFG